MNISKALFRRTYSTPYIGIASIVIDNELIINDIKVYDKDTGNGYDIAFPNDINTKLHGKKNIVPASFEAWQKIHASIEKAVKVELTNNNK